MKLHLPKLLLTAVLAACVAPTAWAGTYSAVYKGTGDKEYIHNYNFVNDENSGESLGWEAAISSTAQNTDKNRIVHFTSSTTDVDNNILKIQFNSLQIGGIVVDADTKVAGLSYDGNRDFYFGKENETSESSINRDFSITPSKDLHFNGTQTWNIASNATLTLDAGSSYSVILNAGSAITQQGGTMSFSGDSVTGTGSYIVESGTLSNAVFKSGATLGLGSSSAVLSTVTMESGSILDLTKLTLSADAAAVSTTGVTLKSGMIVSLSGIEEGDAVKIFDTSVSGVSFIIDGKVIVAGRSEITENSGSYTFTTLGGNLHDMVWAGGDGTWNKTNTNWNSASSGTGMAFADGDSVTFSSSAAVIVEGGVSVGGMTVSGSTTELSLTRTNSGYIAGDVTVEGGAKLVIGSQTDTVGFVRGDINVTNGTLQYNVKDATGYNGGADSTQNIKIAAGSQLLLNHNSNETFAGDIVLNGTMKGVSASGSARWDLYGGSASLSVESGNTATLENVELQLRQNDSEITVANDATLTLEKGMSKGAEGNGKFKKLGNGALSIEGKIDVSGISVNGGSVTFSAGGSTGDISMNANDTTLLFNAADNATADAPTTYTVGDISTTTYDWFNRNITIADNVKVDAASLTNSWGMGTLQVDGVLNFTGDLKLSTGGNTMGEKNIISGDGSVTTATLTIGNVGKYTLNVKSLTATSSTIGQHTQVIGGEANLGTLSLDGKLEANGGKVVISSLTGAGTLTGTNGTIVLESGTHQIATLDMSNSNNAQGSTILKESAALTVTGELWACSTSAIKLEEGASLTKGVVTVAGNSTATPAQISASANLAYVHSGEDGAKYSISNATVTVNTTDAEVSLSNCLNNSILVNGGSNTLTTTNGSNNLSGIDATSGNINVTWFNQNGQQGVLNSLTIGDSKTVGIYTATPGTDNEGTITTNSLTAGTNATLNANLVLASGAAVTMDGALTMGSTVTLGEGMTLAGDLVSTIEGMSADGTVDLFTGVDALYLGASTVASGTLDATSAVSLGTYFTGMDDYYLGYDGQRVFAGVMPTIPVTPAVPEPTTATLSLLALAGLAARRRRR